MLFSAIVSADAFSESKCMIELGPDQCLAAYTGKYEVENMSKENPENTRRWRNVTFNTVARQSVCLVSNVQCIAVRDQLIFFLCRVILGTNNFTRISVCSYASSVANLARRTAAARPSTARSDFQS